MRKLRETTKINENLTTNVLIYIYIYIFFWSQRSRFSASFILFSRTKQRIKDAEKPGGGSHGKAWHIWNEIIFSPILSYSIVLYFFYIPVSSVLRTRTDTFGFVRANPKCFCTCAKHASGEVTARLDTMVVRIMYTVCVQLI